MDVPGQDLEAGAETVPVGGHLPGSAECDLEGIVGFALVLQGPVLETDDLLVVLQSLLSGGSGVDDVEVGFEIVDGDENRLAFAGLPEEFDVGSSLSIARV